MVKALVAAAFLLAACSHGQAAPMQPEPENERNHSPSPSPTATARMVEEKEALLDFTYGWPAQAAAIPALAAHLEADLAKQRTEARATAEADRAGRTADLPFNGHYFSKVWSGAGEGPLLSLSASTETFTGGAHGNLAFEHMLWDRAAGKAVTFESLFTDSAAALAELSRRYCEALDQERSIRREDPLPLEGDEWLTGCPKLTDQAVALLDENKDGRFEALQVLVPPYEAGSYAEGAYVVETPLEGKVTALIKPEYQSAF